MRSLISTITAFLSIVAHCYVPEAQDLNKDSSLKDYQMPKDTEE